MKRKKKRAGGEAKKNYCTAKCWRRHNNKWKQDSRYQETTNVIKQTSTTAAAATTHATNTLTTDRPIDRHTYVCTHSAIHLHGQNSILILKTATQKKIIYGVHKQQQKQQPQQQQRQSKQKQQPRKTAQKNNALLHNSSGYIFLFWMRICSVLSSQTITHRFECGEQGERGERTEKRRRRRRREKKTAQEQHSMMHFIVANTVRSRIESFRFA